ncbi:alpha/beta hydrolase [Sphingomonas sp. RS2018]
MTEPHIRPDVAAFLAYANAMPGPRMHEGSADAARALFRQAGQLTDLPPGDLATVRDIAIPGPAGTIPARLFDARERREPGPVLVFYHGGGFVIGDLDTHAGICAEIARMLDLPVVSVDYRMAPEHPFPAATDDAEAAARWLAGAPAELDRAVTGLVVCGDSAGGNLAIVVAAALRDAPAAVPVIAQLPIYPATDYTREYPSYDEHSDGRMLTRELMAWFIKAYAPEAEHVRCSPLTGDLTGMPPAVVLTAGLDPIRDQGRAYAARLIEAGVPVVFREAVGNIHGFVTMRRALPSSIGDVAGFLIAAKDVIQEAEANRVMAQAAPATETPA